MVALHSICSTKWLTFVHLILFILSFGCANKQCCVHKFVINYYLILTIGPVSCHLAWMLGLMLFSQKLEFACYLILTYVNLVAIDCFWFVMRFNVLPVANIRPLWTKARCLIFLMFGLICDFYQYLVILWTVMLAYHY